jgi:hypothetical protein
VDEWEQPVLVVRGRRGQVEARRDREVLAWVARFRFVTAEVVAERFGISVRRADARISALEAAGLVVCRKDSGSQRRAVFVSRAGALALGLTPRRPPRPEVHRAHELAIARLAGALERASSETVVLTERECRRRERDEPARYSVDLVQPGVGRVRRWPDLVLVAGAGRVAVEIELAAKPTERLRRIVAGYASGGVFSAVRFLVASPALAGRLARICADHGPIARLAAVPTRLIVMPWPGAPAEDVARIEAAIASAAPGA